MLRNYFITAFRFLLKNQLFTSINIIGLAVSIACSMLIYMYVKNELTYDEFHADIDRLYIIGEGNNEENPEEAAYYQTVFPAFPTMAKEFPEIENGARWFDWEQHALMVDDKRFIERIHYVDTGFLQTLSFPLLYGDPAKALLKKDQIVISKQIAEKIFGIVDVVGKEIKTETGNVYSVSGVLDDIPVNSSVRPEVLVSILEKEDQKDFHQLGNWYNTIAQVVIKLKAGTDVNQLRAKLPAFVKQHYHEAAKDRILKIYPFSDLRQSESTNEKYIYGLSSIGVFILLIAIINYMNLSIAASLKRLRETGMRKIMGSGRQSIFVQFFMETSLLSILAFIVGVGFLQLMLPLINEMLSLSLQLTGSYLKDLAIICLSLTILIGLVAGGYPAFYLSSFNTVSAVKGIIPNYQNKATLRNALVVVQFVVSIAMIVGVLVTSRQIRFMKTADLKFNKENVLVAELSGGFQDEKAARRRIKGIVNELRQNADIMSISLSQNVPGRYWESYNGFTPEGQTNSIGLRQATVDDQYLSTFGINVLEGRNFSREIPTDTLNKVMINKAAMEAMGWNSAIGKTLQPKGMDQQLTVIGVFDDFHYRSLEGNVQPLIHYYSGPEGRNANFLIMKVVPEKAKGIIAFLQKEWKPLDAFTDLTYFFVDEDFNRQYRNVETTLFLIGLFAFVAIVISCSGIFALSAIAAQQRTKEIGIRKVLGASVMSVVSLLSRDFIKLVAIAVVLATPLAWYGMNEWLQDFAYRVGLEWWLFTLAGILAITIAFFTIGVQAIRAAMNNPVNSLRND
jgi:putative ABC transport system permease protein